MHSVVCDEIKYGVRSSEDHKYWSIRDIVNFFCPELEAGDAETIAAYCIRELMDNCVLHHRMMSRSGTGTRGWSSCVAVRASHVPDVLILLPRNKARRLYTNLLVAAIMEKSRRQFIEANSSRWEAVGRIFQSRREGLGLSAQVVATALGVSRSLIRKFERGMPIQRASLVENAYRYFLKFHVLTQTSFGHLNKGMEDWEQAQIWLHLSDEDEEFDANQPWPNSAVG